ncbi:MAG: hypothetical protein HYS13_00050 [Planctomycetia bacterium]|nr:hypothetical protein [Planctomycetia bacterium]
MSGQEREYGPAAGNRQRAATYASGGARPWYETAQRPWYTVVLAAAKTAVEPRLPWYGVYPRQPWYRRYPYVPWYSHWAYRPWYAGMWYAGMPYGRSYWGWPYGSLSYGGLLYRPWHATSYGFYRPWCSAGDRWWGGCGWGWTGNDGEFEAHPEMLQWDGSRRSYGGIHDW